MPNKDFPDNPFDIEDFPWPTDGIDLRASNNNPSDHSFLGWRPPVEARIAGFRKAAEILADSFIANSSYQDLDTIVFPYVTCWRHYTELHVKYLIAQLQGLLRKGAKRRGGHKIDQLWSELKPLLKEAKLDGTKDEHRNVTQLIDQLARLDPDSQDFRYAERADGAWSLDDVSHIDLANFHQGMLGAANYLSALETAIDVRRD